MAGSSKGRSLRWGRPGPLAVSFSTGLKLPSPPQLPHSPSCCGVPVAQALGGTGPYVPASFLRRRLNTWFHLLPPPPPTSLPVADVPQMTRGEDGGRRLSLRIKWPPALTLNVFCGQKQATTLPLVTTWSGLVVHIHNFYSKQSRFNSQVKATITGGTAIHLLKLEPCDPEQLCYSRAAPHPKQHCSGRRPRQEKLWERQ